MKRLALLVLVFTIGCASNMPPNLSQPAQVAYYASRVVTVLDLVRDSSLVFMVGAPPNLTVADAKTVVTWHQRVVQLILSTPGGWVPVIKASIFTITCDPMASDIVPIPACKPLIQSDRLLPYFRIALSVLSEVPVALRDISEDIIKAFKDQCAKSLAVDKAWLESHA